MQRTLREIGFSVNPTKSSAITIKKGNHQIHNLPLETGEEIVAADKNEIIKYLGSNFSGELIFNDDPLITMHKNLIIA